VNIDIALGSAFAKTSVKLLVTGRIFVNTRIRLSPFIFYIFKLKDIKSYEKWKNNNNVYIITIIKF